MALWRNKDSILTFTEPGAVYPTSIAPGSVLSDDISPMIRQLAGMGLMEPFDSVRSFIKEHPNARIAMIRTYALGDVLMLWAVINCVRRQYPFLNLTLLTDQSYVSVFEGSGMRVMAYRGIPEGYDLIFMMDSLLEKDHDGGDLSKIHRVNIYLRALGWER